MIRKRNFKTSILLLFRNAGLICKSKRHPKKGLRISRSVMPDGTIIIHDKLVQTPPINNDIIGAMIHSFNMSQEIVNKFKPIK